jgi:hypothetical protein
VTGDGECVLYCDSFLCTEIGTKLVDDPATVEGMDAETCCQVDLNICRANKYVADNSCAYCPIGTSNEPGDDIRGVDTTCDAVVCQTNQYVLWNTCASCPAGFQNEAGDYASGFDTVCSSISTTGMCTGNTNSSEDATCPAQNNQTMLHKPDPYTIHCELGCLIQECCDPMPTEPPELIYMWEATPFPECPAVCGKPRTWLNFTRTVRCVEISRYSTGALVRKDEVVPEGNSTQCPGDAPASTLVCDSLLPVGHACDDSDPSTSNDQCRGQTSANASCAGIVLLAAAVTIPVEEEALPDDAVPPPLPSDAVSEVEARQNDLLSNLIAMAIRASLAEALGVPESAITITDMVTVDSGDRRRRRHRRRLQVQGISIDGITIYFVVSVTADQADAVRAAANDLSLPDIVIPGEATASGLPITVSGDFIALNVALKEYSYFRTGTCPIGLTCSNRCGTEAITSVDVWTCTEDGMAVLHDVCIARGLGSAPETRQVCCPAPAPDTCIASAQDLMPPPPEPEPPEPEPEPEPPAMDCVGAWGNWSDCNTTCGGGIQDRNYTVTVPAYADGAACDVVDGGSGTQECNVEACPPEPEPEPEEEEHWWPFSPMVTYIIIGGGSCFMCMLIACCCWLLRKCRKGKPYEESPSLTPQEELQKVMNVAKATAKLKKPIREKRKQQQQIDHLAAARAAQEAKERAAAERQARDEERARLLAEEEAARRAAAEEEARRRAENKRLRELESARLAGLSARERWRETQMSERERARIMWKDLQADSGTYQPRDPTEEQVQDYREKDFFGGASLVKPAELPLGIATADAASMPREGRALEP